MNINTLLNTIDTLGYSGQILTTEEAIVLHNSLLLLQNENHFRNIFFWGKIFGTNKDYYVAYGYVKDVLHGQIYYYSSDGTNWGLLPPVTDMAKLFTPLCTTRFQGDPALVIDVLCERDDPTVNRQFGDRDVVKKLKEEDRLAATIFLINEEARIVPRGALYHSPDNLVVENLTFEGLNALDARELQCYLHFRPPRQKWNTNLLTRKDYNYGLDCLDTINVDIPPGCWTLQIHGGNMMVVKSLFWPGMVMYHYMDTPFYGVVYIGYGKKNLDVPFMLPTIDY